MLLYLAYKYRFTSRFLAAQNVGITHIYPPFCSSLPTKVPTVIYGSIAGSAYPHMGKMPLSFAGVQASCVSQNPSRVRCAAYRTCALDRTCTTHGEQSCQQNRKMIKHSLLMKILACSTVNAVLCRYGRTSSYCRATKA